MACQASLARISRMRWPPEACSAAGRTRQEPSMRRWVCTVSPASVRVSRCFPRERVSVTVWPVRSAVANRGTRKSERVSTLPASAPCSRRAVSHTRSPSGTRPAYGWPEASVRLLGPHSRGSPFAMNVTRSAEPEQVPAGSEDLAEPEQVPDAGLDLEAAAQPGAPDAARVVGDGDQVVTLGGEPDLGGGLGSVRLHDR